MPFYVVKSQRISVREIEVEAESAAEAHAKVSAMTAYQLESQPEDDHYWEFSWHAQRVDEDLNPIDEPPAEPMIESVRLDAEEIYRCLGELAAFQEHA
jgi:hypothetical protein